MLLSLVFLLLIGLAAGTLAGLLGIGGGLVIVPAVTALLSAHSVDESVAVPVAVATSLSTMLLTAVSAVWFHARRGAVDWPTISRLGSGVAVGAAAGALLATLVSGETLARVFAIIAAIIGVRMMLAETPRPAAREPFPRLWWLAGPLIGAASALVGIGGGTFNVPYLTRNGYDMVRAVANASACGWPIALAGTVVFIALAPTGPGPGHLVGHVWLPGTFAIGLGGVLAAPLGVTLAHRLPAGALRRVFGGVLILVAARMAW
ncbi:sulfite exporter TauE/SafE family protein [Wenzhouxiangella sediminis]|uniref:Probable membrane transporter protein n=1 Tax=Wenzhouxiangella sediminis TaxID=1792836 RepID=A0A3E1K7W9_9GAMM|nr:sulfite exporter TauE/SafE family protein [Wenzhouxiangella sediminis]RFF30158.1 sulfite exporter TauE/SafE family protein [Wenzhouxiangella sediminis]